jgi:hypothetical protein
LRGRCPGSVSTPRARASYGLECCSLVWRLNVRYWHFSDIPPAPTNVRYRGQSGHDADAEQCPLTTHNGHWRLHDCEGYYAGKLEICSSGRDWRRTTHAPCKASPAMIVATITSGQPVPVPSTPRAASNTARLPKTSLRVQIQAERMFASPPRNAHKSPNEAALAISAATPTAPIVAA